MIAIDSHSKCYVNAIPATPEDLVPRVQKALEDKKEKLVYLKRDKDVKYSTIMDATDALRMAQVENIALITERKPRSGRGQPPPLALNSGE